MAKRKRERERKQARRDDPFVLIVSLLVFFGFGVLDFLNGKEEEINILIYAMPGSVFAGGLIARILEGKRIP